MQLKLFQPITITDFAHDQGGWALWKLSCASKWKQVEPRVHHGQLFPRFDCAKIVEKYIQIRSKNWSHKAMKIAMDRPIGQFKQFVFDVHLMTM